MRYHKAASLVTVAAAIPGASHPGRGAENLGLAIPPISAVLWRDLRQAGPVSSDAPLPV
jgi:D-threo-aldose 1-dehydrogenase